MRFVLLIIFACNGAALCLNTIQQKEIDKIQQLVEEDQKDDEWLDRIQQNIRNESCCEWDSAF